MIKPWRLWEIREVSLPSISHNTCLFYLYYFTLLGKILLEQNILFKKKKKTSKTLL